MTRVAVLADIHSNPDALEAVLDDADGAGAEAVWVAGDVFGYGLAACETWRLVCGALPLAVLGNHDLWTLHPALAPTAGVGTGARMNAAELAMSSPEALAWLDTLSLSARPDRDGWQIAMVHGTPPDPLYGRHYPDDENDYPWLPGPGEILILGQTHHPMLRGTAQTGLLLNPGSVGQPRDGDPRPSWALLDTAAGTAELRRVPW